MNEAVNSMVDKRCVFIDSMLHSAKDFFQSLISSEVSTVLAAIGDTSA